MSLKNKLDTYTKLSQKQRKKVIKWLVRQSEDLGLEAFAHQQKYYFELSKYKNENQSLLYFAAYTLAANEIYCHLQPQKGKNKMLNLHEITDSTPLQAKNVRKSIQSPQTDWLLDRKAKIIGWSDYGMSSRDIKAEILKNYKNKEISHTTINNFLKKIKEKNDFK